MNLQQNPTITVEPLSARSESVTRLQGRWLLIARVGWMVLTLLILTLNVVMIPRYYAVLQAHCQPDPQCFALQLTAYDRTLLHQFGLSLGFVAAYQVILDAVLVLVCCALGALIFWRKSADRMALFCAFMLVLLGGAGFTNILQDALMPVSPTWFALIGTLDLLGQTSFLIFFFLFPSGRFVPRWTRWIVPCVVLYWIYTIFFVNGLNNGSMWSPLVFIAILLCIVGVQVYRYRRMSTTRERQRTKWVVFGLSIAIVGFVLTVVAEHAFLPPALQQSSVLQTLVVGTLIYGFLLLIPISIAIAILRYRLWDIDVLINRTLVYGLLTVSIIGMYVFVVGYLGALFRTGNNLPVSLFATGLVAVLFQPLRLRLQRGVNRLMYGERDTPGKVISRLGQRLETTLAPDAVLPTIVETVAQALKLPYAAITLQQDGEFVPAASYGQVPKEDLVRLPLVYQNEQIGELRLAPRAPGETFTSADRALLNDLARQAGIAASAVRLTIDLQRLAGELQHSRTQLVTTREEERRRLRRDLHDGLGPRPRKPDPAARHRPQPVQEQTLLLLMRCSST